MKKTLLIIGIILLLAFGYFINQKPQGFYTKLSQETGITFSAPVSHEFEWVLNEQYEKVTVSAEQSVGETTLKDSNLVDEFFNRNGYELDHYNLADGTVVSLVGYKKENSVCTVIFRTEYEEFTMPDENAKTNVEVSCGVLN